MGSVGDEKVIRGNGDTLLFKGGDFSRKTNGVQNYPVADDVLLPRPEDP